jgi:hypothetical protein
MIFKNKYSESLFLNQYKAAYKAAQGVLYTKTGMYSLDLGKRH